MHVNFDDEKKSIMKKSTAKEKKEKCDNLNDSEKEELRKHKKEVKKVMHYDFDDEKKYHLKNKYNKRRTE